MNIEKVKQLIKNKITSPEILTQLAKNLETPSEILMPKITYIKN